MIRRGNAQYKNDFCVAYFEVGVQRRVLQGMPDRFVVVLIAILPKAKST